LYIIGGEKDPLAALGRREDALSYRMRANTIPIFSRYIDPRGVPRLTFRYMRAWVESAPPRLGLRISPLLMLAMDLLDQVRGLLVEGDKGGGVEIGGGRGEGVVVVVVALMLLLQQWSPLFQITQYFPSIPLFLPPSSSSSLSIIGDGEALQAESGSDKW